MAGRILTPDQMAAMEGAGKDTDTSTHNPAAKGRVLTPDQMSSLESQNKVSPLGSFGRGAISGASFGYAPQVYGGLANIFGGDYLKNRDAASAYLAQGKAENPISSFAGNMVGGGASIFGLGELTAAAAPLVGLGGLIEAAPVAGVEGLGSKSAIRSLLSGGLKGSATGAAIGGLSNPGDTPGEYSGLQANEREQNAGLGALLGFPMGAAGGYIANQAKVAKMAGMDPDTLETGLKGVLSKAAGAIQKEKIDPAMEAARRAAANEENPFIEYNTRRLGGFKEKQITEPFGTQDFQPTFPPILTESGRQTLSTEEALPIIQKLGEMSKFRPQASDTSRAANELASGEWETLRDGLKQASPEADSALRVAHDNIGLKTDIENMKGNPIDKMRPTGGTGAQLSAAGKVSGIDLPGIARTNVNANSPDLNANIMHWPTLLLRKSGSFIGQAGRPLMAAEQYLGKNIPVTKATTAAILNQLALDRSRQYSGGQR